MSAYAVAPDGALDLVNAVAVTGAGHPTGEIVGGANGGPFVLDTVGHPIVTSAIGANGTLGASGTASSGLPNSTVGPAPTQG